MLMIQFRFRHSFFVPQALWPSTDPVGRPTYPADERAAVGPTGQTLIQIPQGDPFLVQLIAVLSACFLSVKPR